MARRRQKSISATLLTAVIALFIWYGQSHGWFAQAATVAETNQPGLYSVSRFSDGDTITVDMNGTPETIRFIGVDTPETHDPRKKVQCGGPAASAFTKNLITSHGLKVRLASDSLSNNRDRYNRLLRYVYLSDGTFVNETLISGGYGFYYPYFKFSKMDEFAAAQASAQAGHEGLWGNCSPVKTDGGGYTSNNQ